MSKTTEEILSPREWKQKHLDDTNQVAATPFGLFDPADMRKYADYVYEVRIQDKLDKITDMRVEILSQRTGLTGLAVSQGLKSIESMLRNNDPEATKTETK